MDIEHLEPKGNVNNIKVIGKRGSVRISFRHTLTDKSDKMIVDTVDYGQGPKRGWSEHGELQDLLLKFTGETFKGTRDPWLRNLYKSQPTSPDRTGSKKETFIKPLEIKEIVNTLTVLPSQPETSSLVDQADGFTLTLSGPTDIYTVTKRRAEQPQLRKLLGLDKGPKQCAICGHMISKELLVAAHIKKRSKASDDERKDASIVVPMCILGCDALFEQGLIGVYEGSVVRNKKISTTNYVESTIRSLVGKKIVDIYWSPLTEKYYTWHMKFHKGNL